MELTGFHVSVHCGDEQLKEYSIEISPDGKKVTCWIPSESGRRFKVRYREEETSAIKGQPKVVDVFMDGHMLEGVAFLPSSTGGTIDGVCARNNTRRPFMFAEIQTTDEDDVPGGDHAKLEDMGTISVKVFLVDSYKRSETSSRTGNPVRNLQPAVVHERSKKAGEHCISLGDEEKYTSNSWYSMNWDSENPTLVFEFRYRPVAMLQAMRIMPLPKRQHPLVIDLEDDEQPHPKRQKAASNGSPVQSTQAELEWLRNRVKELEGQKAGPSGVKKEELKPEPIDIIDLT